MMTITNAEMKESLRERPDGHFLDLGYDVTTEKKEKTTLLCTIIWNFSLFLFQGVCCFIPGAL